MAYKRNVEIFEEAYTKKGDKSTLSYVARDGRRRYIAGNKNPDGGGGMTEVTWQELKDKRDNGKLNPGSLYRITDYNCTTTQENTQSAGHQFDIVLLALSEDKLAEEGWAMEHPTDVYDVTFDDEVTVKCYFYPYGIDMANIVSTETKLGCAFALDELVVDNEKKTIFIEGYDSFCLDQPITYNYFQNSNLSAWKVWYCLDNDTARFAWADDASEESIVINSVTFNRYPEQDTDGYYGWKHENSYVFTSTLTPKIGDMAYVSDGEGGYDEEDPIEAVSGFGRGVIYRLIDEWGNDCPYDFKNILYLRQLTAGVIDAQGTDTYIPTFCLYDIGNTEYRDASIFAIYYPSDENIIGACYDNIIKMVNTSDIEECYASELPNNIILELVETGDTSWQTHSNIIFAKSCSFCAMINSNVIYASEKTYTHIPSGIIFGNKQVVWENIS